MIIAHQYQLSGGIQATKPEIKITKVKKSGLSNHDYML